jgi:plasmid stabilization system protein ParE
MRLVFRSEAQKELLDAQAWYEARAVGLGFDFARAVDSAVQKALRMPFAFPRIDVEFRLVVTRRFPYSIIYYVSDTELVVVSCFHHRRNTVAWSRDSNIRESI